MTKHTKRDYVWTAALDLRSEALEEQPDRRFEVVDVLERIESMDTPELDAMPSERTVHDVLATMLALDELGGYVGASIRSEFKAPWRLAR